MRVRDPNSQVATHCCRELRSWVTIGGVELLKSASCRRAEGETCHGRQDRIVPLRGCRIRDYGTAQLGDCMPLSSMSQADGHLYVISASLLMATSSATAPGTTTRSLAGDFRHPDCTRSHKHLRSTWTSASVLRHQAEHLGSATTSPIS